MTTRLQQGNPCACEQLREGKEEHKEMTNSSTDYSCELISCRLRKTIGLPVQSAGNKPKSR